MTINEILAQQTTKTKKIAALLALGLTRRETAEALGIGYGFVQNVYARIYGVSRHNNRRQTGWLNNSAFNFVFNRTFGVEIEAYGATEAEVVNALQQRGLTATCVRRTENHYGAWKVTTDSSIDGANAFELVSPILNGEAGLEQLQLACQALEEVGANVNKSCGLHIHLGAADLTLSNWKDVILNYINFETTIDSIMPLSRRANNNRFCHSNIKQTLENTRELIASATTLTSLANKISPTRYYKINMKAYWEHRTIEFRQHSGTIEYAKISNWILLLTRLVEFSKTRVATAQDLDAMAEFLHAEGLEFYRQRQLHFAA